MVQATPISKLGVYTDGWSDVIEGGAPLADKVKREFVNNLKAAEIPGLHVMSLAEDGAGAVWMATYGGGVVRFDGDNFQSWTTRQGLPDDRVWCIRVDEQNRVWAGTDTGIWVHPLDGSGDFTVTTRSGLPSKSVWFLVEDIHHRVWAGTTRGVALVSPDGRVDRVYTDASGLSHIEAAQNAAFRDSHNRLWMGMISGVTVAEPGMLRTNMQPPTLVLEKVLVNDRPLDGFRQLDAAADRPVPRFDLLKRKQYVYLGKKLDAELEARIATLETQDAEKARVVKEEMLFGLKSHNVDPAEFDKRIRESLEIVDLSDKIDSEVFDLGKGQKQRLALASVLTLKPKILIIDEQD